MWNKTVKKEGRKDEIKCARNSVIGEIIGFMKNDRKNRRNND